MLDAGLPKSRIQNPESEQGREMVEKVIRLGGPKAKLALFSASGALVVGGIVAALNLLAAYATLRLDFSQGRIYSLSPASKQLLKRLEDPVYMTAYFSPSLPPQYAASRDYLENLLKEYASASRGKVRYEFYSAEDSEKFRQAALREGIYPIRFNILEKERYEVREAFLGLVVKYLDRKEVLPFLQDPTGLEYDLTSRIKKMMRTRRKQLGLVSSNGALGPEALPQALRARLEENYEVKTVDLVNDSTGAFAELDALILLGPEVRLEDRAVFALDQFLLSGKSLALALDPKRVDLRSFLGAPLDLGLDGWLMHLGLPLRKNIVLDLQNQKVSISAQQGWLSITNIVDYPPFVLATDLNAEHPLTKGLDSLVLPYPAALDLSTAAAGVRMTPMVRSSRRSWMKASWDRQFASLNPFESHLPTAEDPKGPFVLAAVVEGRFRSYFPAPPPKTQEKASGEKGKGKVTSAPVAEEFLKESKAPGRVVLVGTSRFIHKDYPLPETNVAFFLNLSDWLVQDPELIAIRSKAVAYRPLREISPGWKTAVRYGNLLAGPFLVVGLGFYRWRRRSVQTALRVALYKAS